MLPYVMVEANVHLRPLHTSMFDIHKVFEPLVCCLKGIWVHPYTVTLSEPQIWEVRVTCGVKWCHNIMVEAGIHAPLIAIVSCKCPCTSLTPRGTSSPCSNMAYQPAFPHKASCRGSNHTPWTCDCRDTLWAWSCWACPYWPQGKQFWQWCWDRLNITNCIGWCMWVVLRLPHCKNLYCMGQSIALHLLMLALPLP